MSESYSVKAILSAVDKGFVSTLKGAGGALDSLGSKIKSGLGFGFIAGAGQQAFSQISSGIRGVIDNVQSSNASWKTFASNLSMLGTSADEIDSVKKDLQDFAEKTIYSASDMATTYSQLAAVGTKNCDKLVKGFGGLAAASENPKQAMKSLSMQATQMAAKPSIAWADFKIMLEQSPAGIAAVAREMGMSTNELVSSVQDGTIATQDFFDAIASAGTNEAFTELATSYKTIGQAADGLQDSISNKVAPAFEVLSQVGIGALTGIQDKIGAIDAQGLADKVSGWIEKAKPYWFQFTGIMTRVKTTFFRLYNSFKQTGAFEAVKEAVSAIGVAFKNIANSGAAGSFDSIATAIGNIVKWIAQAVTKVANFIASLKPGTVEKIAKAIGIAIVAFKGFGILRTITPLVSLLGGGFSKIATTFGGGLVGKLFGASNATKAVGAAASASNGSMLESAKAFALMGVGVLAVALGFGILAAASIALANSGGMAVGIMVGMVAAVALLGIGMAALLKSLAPMSAQLMPAAIAMLALGGAVILVAAGFAILTACSIALANSGGVAIAVMGGMVLALAGLMALAAVLGPALTAGAVGMLAFGAAVLMVGIGAVLAAASLAIIVSILPTLVTYGAAGAIAIAQLGAGLLAFGAGAIVGGAGALVLAAGVAAVGVAALASSVGMLAFAAGMTASAAGSLIMAAALVMIASQMKTIAKSATTAKQSLDGMQDTVSVVEGALDSLGDKAKSALDAVIGAFTKTSSASQTEGQKVGTGFATGMQSGLAKAPAVAMAASMMVGMALRSGYSSAYSSGAFIGQGFANGMMASLVLIRSAAAQMAVAADEAVRAKAKIGSPSKVAAKLGSWFGEGFGNGIASMADFVRRATYDIVNIPTVATPDMAMAYSGTLSADYDYVRNNSYTIEVPVIVDGRETARATATYMQAELDQRQARNNRKLGRV